MKTQGFKGIGDIHADAIQGIVLHQMKHTPKKQLIIKVYNSIDARNFLLHYNVLT